MKSSNMEAVVCSSQCSLYKDWTKEEKALLFQHQTTETIQTECQIVTNVTQMLANRLQGSFIPQIKRIPPSNDISFNLLWIKCQCSYVNCSLRFLQWDSPFLYWILNKTKETLKSFYTSILSSACAEYGPLRLWYNCLILRKRIWNYQNHKTFFFFL